MERVVYNGDLQAFIGGIFSQSFINEAEATTKRILGSFFRELSINEQTGSYIYPTTLFQSLNHRLGDRSYDLDSEIRKDYLEKLNLTSTEVLHVIITDLISTREFERYHPDFADADISTQGAILEELFAKQHESLPNYFEEKLLTMIYLFASEFDLSDGRMEDDHFNEVFDRYTDLPTYNADRFTASILAK